MIFYDSFNHSTNIAENSFLLNFVPIYIFIPITKTLETHVGAHAGAVHHEYRADAAPQAVTHSWLALEGTVVTVLAAHGD